MSDQYIKMILALPDEFFDGWEWQAGDKALSINDQYKRELLLLTTAPLEKLNSNDNVTLLFPHSVDGVTVEEYIFNLRPLPSQEQLQKKMLLKNPNIDGLYHLHKIFDGWVTVYLIMNKFENYNQAWLAFAVSIILNLEWNGEAWK